MKKKIISFSLWGKIRLYCIGAIKNAILAKKFFPGWICRFYYDKSVPEKIINKLKELDNTELVFIEKEVLKYKIMEHLVVYGILVCMIKC